MTEGVKLLVANKDNILKYINSLLELDQIAFKENTWEKQNFLLEFSEKSKYSLLAIDPFNQLVGYLFAYTYNLDSVHISRIASDKGSGLSGIGTKLVNKLIVLCRERKLRKITLEFDKSLVVGHFYKQFGFRKLTENSIKNYLIAKKKLAKYNLYIGPNATRIIMVMVL